MACVLFRKGVPERETWLIRKLEDAYRPLLAFTVRRRVVPVTAALVLFAGAAAIVPLLGAEFIPRLDEGAIAMQAVRLPAVPLEESLRYTTRIEESIEEHFPDEVRSIISRTGRAEIATDPMGVELSDIFIMLEPRERWTRADSKEELVEAMRAALLAEVPGQNYLFSQPIELRTNELISGVRSDVAVKLYGDDLETLARLGERIENVVRRVPGAGDVEAEQVSGLPFLRVRADRRAIARYGVSVEDVMNAVSSVAGHAVGEVFEGQRRFALQVRLAPGARRDIDAIRNVPIRTPAGTTVPVGELAELHFEDGPAQIGRENVQRRVAVMANVRGRDLGGFVSEAQERVAAEVAMPPGYFVEWGGQLKNLEKASERLALAVPAALVLIFLLLYMTYRSARPAILIYLNVPFAAVGGVFALAARGMPLSISAGVGFIALFGIAVLNGVVLVSHIRKLQDDGAPLGEATLEGARERLRPVLMTALVASLGFVPMATATSAGAEVQRPLATVVIGGLVTATLLTLLVLPAIYGSFGGSKVSTSA
jgi:cobalt-zinc-cadmium resistance protein CzcA